ncbi:MAG: hypothetical protein H7293_16240 [Candidatus Saccharibacteria bacterium]|nr:hypothetical protein [Rhodoferax sp.]
MAWLLEMPPLDRKAHRLVDLAHTTVDALPSAGTSEQPAHRRTVLFNFLY